MRNMLLIAALSTVLTACGGSSSSPNTDPSPGSTAEQDNDTTSVKITNSGGNYTITNSAISLKITGSDNTFTIYAELSELSIVGSRNLLIFMHTTAIDDCSVTGSDNSAEDSTGVATSFNCSVTGSDNTGF
ncbi:hypothetical protein [Teredinibacter turnerae]|uniref:hypothetical protein n=1 Tax=Teredinibacter turnerae TaxID=2426 RepID=UPI00039F69BD|nr:hypothetical protein [Teredinibacter turnerae]